MLTLCGYGARLVYAYFVNNPGILEAQFGRLNLGARRGARFGMNEGLRRGVCFTIIRDISCRCETKTLRHVPGCWGERELKSALKNAYAKVAPNVL